MGNTAAPRSFANIGYEKAGFGDFIRTLETAGIGHVLDVRELPLSRRAGFSKRQLAAGLLEAGIAYTHLKGLGTPKDGRTAAKAGRMDEFRRIFAAHMKTDVAQSELLRAAELIKSSSSCLLCYEGEPSCCHRSVVAADLSRITGLKVIDLRVEAF